MKTNNDAIENIDVSADEVAAGEQEQHTDKPEAKREPSERDRRLAEIAKQNDELNGIKREPETIEGELVEGDEAKPKEKLAAQDDPLSELGYYRNGAGELVTKMKINGEEREVKADQVKAYIQKDLAGDTKLQQASEKERKLQEQERSLSEREQSLKKSLTKPPSDEDAAQTLTRVKGVLEKIYDGDTDTAAQAMVELLQRGNATALTTEQIESIAEKSSLTAIERDSARKQQEAWNSSVDEGNRELAKAHPEIWKDEKLFNLVNLETERIVEAQQKGHPDYINLTPKLIIEKAAANVSDWMNKRSAPDSGQQSRAERKAGLKVIPQGMSAAQKPKAKQELDMSPKAVIARMRAGRVSAS